MMSSATLVLAMLGSGVKALHVGITRRSLMSSVVVTTVPTLVYAEEDVKKLTTERLKLDAGSIAVPSVWQRDGSSLQDPVLGTVTSSFGIHSKGVAADSIMALGGRIDTFDLKLLDLKQPRALGDIVAARKRTDENGILYYDWDLAVSPLNCPAEQRLVVTTCLPDEVALVSAAVSDGNLYVFECAVTPPQWKNFAKALRTLRDSFLVSSSS